MGFCLARIVIVLFFCFCMLRDLSVYLEVRKCRVSRSLVRSDIRLRPQREPRPCNPIRKRRWAIRQNLETSRRNALHHRELQRDREPLIEPCGVDPFQNLPLPSRDVVIHCGFVCDVCGEDRDKPPELVVDEAVCPLPLPLP